MENLTCSYAKKLIMQRNVEVASLQKKMFAQVANPNEKVLPIDMKIIRELQDEVKIGGSMAIVEMTREDIEEERKRTMIFRTYSNKAHKIDWTPERLIEAALKPI